MLRKKRKETVVRTSTDRRFVGILLTVALAVCAFFIWTRLQPDDFEGITPSNPYSEQVSSGPVLTHDVWKRYCSQGERETTGVSQDKHFPAHTCVAAYRIIVGDNTYYQCVLPDAPEEVWIFDGVVYPWYEEVQNLKLCTSP